MTKGYHDRLADYISTETYRQHNPQIGDGIDNFRAFLAGLARQDQSMTYQKVYNVIGSGNFVATLSAVNLAGTDLAVMDLFRVDKGRIAEHWDVIEEITPRETWVNSGKF